MKIVLVSSARMVIVMNVDDLMKKTKSKLGLFHEMGEDLCDALMTIHNFIEQVTGQAPSETEISSALKRYFVLNEIKDHIVMERRKNSDSNY
jgi:hypothetical protein